MSLSIFTGLLALTLLHAPMASADEAIRFSTTAGKQHAELELNGNMECILENDRGSCVPASR